MFLQATLDWLPLEVHAMEPGPYGKYTKVENFPCQLSKHFNKNIEVPV